MSIARFGEGWSPPGGNTRGAFQWSVVSIQGEKQNENEKQSESQKQNENQQKEPDK